VKWVAVAIHMVTADLAWVVDRCARWWLLLLNLDLDPVIDAMRRKSALIHNTFQNLNWNLIVVKRTSVSSIHIESWWALETASKSGWNESTKQNPKARCPETDKAKIVARSAALKARPSQIDDIVFWPKVGWKIFRSFAWIRKWKTIEWFANVPF